MVGFKTGTALDEFLYFVGHMRNDLHRFTEVIAPAFFFQHAFVNLAGGEIVAAAHARFNKTLVMAQVEVGFCAVIGDIHLAVLEG